jgi:hypothetical protein
MTSFYDVTEVKFKPLRDEEIEYYVDNYEPYDKAGGYGAQEWLGYIGIERIEGSFFNVMGLPTARLYDELINFLKLIHNLHYPNVLLQRHHEQYFVGHLVCLLVDLTKFLYLFY